MGIGRMKLGLKRRGSKGKMKISEGGMGVFQLKGNQKGTSENFCTILWGLEHVPNLQYKFLVMSFQLLQKLIQDCNVVYVVIFWVKGEGRWSK